MKSGSSGFCVRRIDPRLLKDVTRQPSDVRSPFLIRRRSFDTNHEGGNCDDVSASVFKCGRARRELRSPLFLTTARPPSLSLSLCAVLRNLRFKTKRRGRRSSQMMLAGRFRVPDSQAHFIRLKGDQSTEGNRGSREKNGTLCIVFHASLVRSVFKLQFGYVTTQTASAAVCGVGVSAHWWAFVKVALCIWPMIWPMRGWAQFCVPAAKRRQSVAWGVNPTDGVVQPILEAPAGAAAAVLRASRLLSPRSGRIRRMQPNPGDSRPGLLAFVCGTDPASTNERMRRGRQTFAVFRCLGCLLFVTVHTVEPFVRRRYDGNRPIPAADPGTDIPGLSNSLKRSAGGLANCQIFPRGPNTRSSG